jgi:hypothetical protein
MNTKIEFGTNQSLTSKLKILLWDAKGCTNGMPQPSLRMEIQRIKIEFVIHKTLKSQPKDEYSQDYGSIQNFI